LRWSGSGELLYRIIKKELASKTHKLILEAGSGKGDIAVRLSMAGHHVVLIDTSLSALKISGNITSSSAHHALFIQASIFALPFKNGLFDFIYNSGVLDHFGEKARMIALEEMLRVSKNSAKVVIVTNDERSFIHPRAMKFAIAHGKWHYGFKDAIFSCKNILPQDQLRCQIREYSRGFISQFEFLRYFISEKGWMQKLFFYLFYLWSFPLGILNLFPGQFLVTVFYQRVDNGESAR
jgi:ubiquinone/menaquinone biosynthesis C-methylase UbiE